MGALALPDRGILVWSSLIYPSFEQILVLIKIFKLVLETIDSELSGLLEYTFIPTLPNMDYDECMAFQSPVTDEPVITGQYCAVSLDSALPNDWRKEVDSFNNSLSKMLIHQIVNMDFFNKSNTNREIAAMRHLIRSKVFKEFDDANHWVDRSRFSVPISMCIPRTCSTTDIEQVVNNGKINLLIQLNLTYKRNR